MAMVMNKAGETTLGTVHRQATGLNTWGNVRKQMEKQKHTTDKFLFTDTPD